MEREDQIAIIRLVARAPSDAVGMLALALHALEHRPRLRVDVEVGRYRIDLVVEQDGRRLGVIVGRTGDSRTAADKERDDALARAGWAVYRLTPERARTRPQVAVSDVLAALREHGREVPPRTAARRRESAPVPVEALRKLSEELGGRRLA